VEFGCGGVIAAETRAGRAATVVVCSRGESASNGTPEARQGEAARGAEALGARLEFLDLGGDGHFQVTPAHAMAIARVIRRLRPGVVLAPTPVENQHPDHCRLGQLVRDAARLARYGGLQELRDLPGRAIEQLLFYAVTPEGEPRDATPLLYDVSGPETLAAWTDAMGAHGSQMASRNYVELQLSRARTYGLRAGVSYAIPLFPADPVVIASLSQVGKGARRF
jgi:LmbE family N-acetylglucosaminyl deacetylase